MSETNKTPEEMKESVKNESVDAVQEAEPIPANPSEKDIDDGIDANKLANAKNDLDKIDESFHHHETASEAKAEDTHPEFIDNDKLEQAKEDLEKMEKRAHTYVEEIHEDYENAGGIKGMCEEKIAEIKEGFEKDPVDTLVDLGTKALLVVGAFALLKAILHK